MSKHREHINRKDVKNDWRTITEKISELEGKKVSRQAVQASHDRLLKKLRHRLASDPYIRDWIVEHGLELGES